MIAEDSEYDKKSRKVELIENLTLCHRKDAEDMKTFTAWFNNVVSLYTNHVGPRTPQTKGQFVSLLLKSARLADDGFNSSLLQWSQARKQQKTTKSTKSRIISEQRIKKLGELVKKVEALATQGDKEQGLENQKLAHAELDEMLQTNVAYVEGDEVFTIEKAISTMSRMKVATKQFSMLTVNDKRKETLEERAERIQKRKMKIIVACVEKRDIGVMTARNARQPWKQGVKRKTKISSSNE